MCTINKKGKRLYQLLMSIGLISMIISFYFSNSNQYSDEEIHSAMVDIVEKSSSDVTEIDIQETLLNIFENTRESIKSDGPLGKIEYDSFFEDLGTKVAEEFYLEGSHTILIKTELVDISNNPETYKLFKIYEFNSELVVFDSVIPHLLSPIIIGIGNENLKKWKYKKISEEIQEEKDIQKISGSITDKLH